ncbi:hypothetical protein [Rhodococcus sp. NPDC049939]|uniref:hypothetical protein n=1 Tax=Rhodococcus sp. NPDC049939 TaxID=3155511 RepID=UPI003411D4AC
MSGITDPSSVQERLLLLDARLGENSPFHQHHGIYVEGIAKDAPTEISIRRFSAPAGCVRRGRGSNAGEC